VEDRKLVGVTLINYFLSSSEINEPNKVMKKIKTCLEMVSDNCFDTTGDASAGLPGLTIGEQIGGMKKSTAEITDINTLFFFCHVTKRLNN